MVFRWPTYSGIWILSPLINLKNKTKKTTVKVGPPLTKLSGSAHDTYSVLSLLRTVRYQKHVD